MSVDIYQANLTLRPLIYRSKARANWINFTQAFLISDCDAGGFGKVFLGNEVQGLSAYGLVLDSSHVFITKMPRVLRPGDGQAHSAAEVPG